MNVFKIYHMKFSDNSLKCWLLTTEDLGNQLGTPESKSMSLIVSVLTILVTPPLSDCCRATCLPKTGSYKALPHPSFLTDSQSWEGTTASITLFRTWPRMPPSSACKMLRHTFAEIIMFSKKSQFPPHIVEWKTVEYITVHYISSKDAHMHR